MSNFINIHMKYILYLYKSVCVCARVCRWSDCEKQCHFVAMESSTDHRGWKKKVKEHMGERTTVYGGDCQIWCQNPTVLLHLNFGF